MAEIEVGMAPTYADLKKAVSVNAVEFEVETGGTDLFIQEGFGGISRGSVMVAFNISEITPKAGPIPSTIWNDLIDKILNQRNVACSIIIGNPGKLYKFWARAKGAKFSSKSESGLSEGSANFRGKILSVTG